MLFRRPQFPIRTYNGGSFPEEWRTWNIKVDIVGFVHRANKPTDLVFVECKNIKLTLSHLSQLLGYSRIAHPLYSFLISPAGFSRSLFSLLNEYHRHEVLSAVAEWEITTRSDDRRCRFIKICYVMSSLKKLEKIT